MGILTPIQRQFIARPDKAKDAILYKWPDRNIRMLTQLTVQQDEVAVFFKDGKVVGTLPVGRHQLDGKAIPFLGELIDPLTGGNILISELYFVSTREFTSLPFGGQLDTIEEPATNLFVKLRFFGEYSLQIADADKLIVNLVGTQNLETNEEVTNWVKSQVLKKAREIVAEHIMAKKWDVVGIAKYNTELEEVLIPLINKELKRYGISIAKFGNVTISLDEKDAEELKRMRRDLLYAKKEGAAEAAMKVGVGRGIEKGTGGAADQRYQTPRV